MLVDDSLARSDDDGLARLSPTERAIARQALAGDSNREIADALFYSVKSVEAYLTRVYRRLGIEGRSGLPIVAEALEDLEPRDRRPSASRAGAAGRPVRLPGRTVVELLIF